MPAPLELIAMHGWAGDARFWEPWKKNTAPKGWIWLTGERGYAQFVPKMPHWTSGLAKRQRMIIAHSLGPHMVPADVWQQANGVVLLASFAKFVTPGYEGRRARVALAGMAASLQDEDRTRAMLENFTRKVAEPQSAKLLPPGPLDGPLDESNRARLREDLELLARCYGLPDGFPRDARILIVEAEEDRIVEPEARRILRESLPGADVITLPGVGHALLAGDVIGRVVEWVEAWRAAAR